MSLENFLAHFSEIKPTLIYLILFISAIIVQITYLARQRQSLIERFGYLTFTKNIIIYIVLAYFIFIIIKSLEERTTYYIYLFKPVVPYFISFFAGAIAGIITFANDFTDKPSVLLKSWWCRAYAIFNGLMAILIYTILSSIDIKILSLSFSDEPAMLSAIVGISWYSFLSSSAINASDSNSEFANSISSMFIKTKKYLYLHYTMNQVTILRPIVWNIIKEINEDEFYDFSIRCINLAKGISAEKGKTLGELYKEYTENSANVNDYKYTIATEITKLIGINLLEQVTKEMHESPTVRDEIDELNARLIEFDENRPQRRP